MYVPKLPPFSASVPLGLVLRLSPEMQLKNCELYNKFLLCGIAKHLSLIELWSA